MVSVLIYFDTKKHKSPPKTYLNQSWLRYKKNHPAKISRVGFLRRRRPTLPLCGAVPSARAGLTSLFGMGRGGAPQL